MRVPASATVLIGVVVLWAIQSDARRVLGNAGFLFVVVVYLVALNVLAVWLRDRTFRVSEATTYLVGVVVLGAVQPWAKQALGGVGFLLLAVGYLVVLRLFVGWLHGTAVTRLRQGE